ncbi:MAG TPA: oligopeptide/dipeptide ABC transporter ATP-binding protein [Thermoanaerobaculia bacterium]|nr:oligopeptide/dipeptide ABC transporter ATP-binding protein [Thermoanaerobaculia bacterium]
MRATDGTEILSVSGLRKYFPVRGGVFGRTVANVHAVEDVSFSVRAAETVGLVGETGSGKTTIGRCILRLIEPTRGSIEFEGIELTRLGSGAMRRMRRDMQIVFQDPYASLNPRMTVGTIVGEPLAIQTSMSARERARRVAQILAKVDLDPGYARRYPHEFSGGQRQRIGVARAIATNPKFIVLDEPLSALDVSVQAQVINLLRDLQHEFALSYLFIAHDLSVVEHLAHSVAVLYLGRIMEIGPRRRIFENALHPYTKALLSAVPIADPAVRKKRVILRGDMPTPLSPPTGCVFHTRCPIAQMPLCRDVVPPLLTYENEHASACHFSGAPIA